jgi:hypothetical protein
MAPEFYPIETYRNFTSSVVEGFHEIETRRKLLKSLATEYNSVTRDQNTVSWELGAKYLLRTKNFDIWNISVDFVHKERRECILKNNVRIDNYYSL